MMELVTGGSGSGKSAYAEDALCGLSGETGEDGGSVRRYYIATMPPWDAETRERIARHRKMRAGKNFLTLERYTDIAGGEALTGADVLVECLSNLTANEMYQEGGAGDRTAEAVVRGILRLRDQCRNLVVVTNDVFGESAEDTPEMRRYKETLGEINRALAEEADRVTEVVRGVPAEVREPRAGQPQEQPPMGGSAEGPSGIRIITGGAFQGKTEWAKRAYPGLEWTDGGACGLEEIRACRAVFRFHEFVKRWLLAGRSREELEGILLEEGRSLVAVCDEIGCGLVPVDAFEREYRETTGRVMTALAERAERVDRVVCGIGVRIKGEKKNAEGRSLKEGKRK